MSAYLVDQGKCKDNYEVYKKRQIIISLLEKAFQQIYIHRNVAFHRDITHIQMFLES